MSAVKGALSLERLHPPGSRKSSGGWYYKYHILSPVQGCARALASRTHALKDPLVEEPCLTDEPSPCEARIFIENTAQQLRSNCGLPPASQPPDMPIRVDLYVLV